MAFPGAVHRHVEEAEPEICADMLQHLLVPCKRSMRGLQEDARSPSMHNRTMQGSLPPVDQTQASEVFQELHSLKAQVEVKLMKMFCPLFTSGTLHLLREIHGPQIQRRIRVQHGYDVRATLQLRGI